MCWSASCSPPGPEPLVVPMRERENTISAQSCIVSERVISQYVGNRQHLIKPFPKKNGWVGDWFSYCNALIVSAIASTKLVLWVYLTLKWEAESLHPAKVQRFLHGWTQYSSILSWSWSWVIVMIILITMIVITSDLWYLARRMMAETGFGPSGDGHGGASRVLQIYC